MMQPPDNQQIALCHLQHQQLGVNLAHRRPEKTLHRIPSEKAESAAGAAISAGSVAPAEAFPVPEDGSEPLAPQSQNGHTYNSTHTQPAESVVEHAAGVTPLSGATANSPFQPALLEQQQQGAHHIMVPALEPLLAAQQDATASVNISNGQLAATSPANASSVQLTTQELVECGLQEPSSIAQWPDLEAMLAQAQELLNNSHLNPDGCALVRQLLTQAAMSGCGPACHLLGQAAEQGLGCLAPDHEEAVIWYGKGAALGDAASAHDLAYALENGLGVQQDIPAAIEWYAVAAEAGHTAAQNNLGRLLVSGSGGMPVNTNTAIFWLQRAAEQGSRAAWFNLGCIYEQGQGGYVVDLPMAAKCYQHAAEQQHLGAMLRLGGLLLAQHQLAESKLWFKAAAGLGSVAAMLQLAKIANEQANALLAQKQQSQVGRNRCSTAAGVSQVAVQSATEAAMQLYWHAATAGSAEAQYVVGCSLWDDGDYDGALELWHEAAGQQYEPALLSLAAAAESGAGGVVKDDVAAAACYALAANLHSLPGSTQ